MQIFIRGCGVSGLTLAWELATRGARVTVAEKHENLAGSASWQAGGMLAPWCERESAEEAVLTLGREAIDWWDKALPGYVTRKGTLVLASSRDAGELARFARRTSGHEAIEAETVADLEPALGGRFARGLFFRGEAHLEPRLALAALYTTLREMGVRFEFNCQGSAASAKAQFTADCTGIAAPLPELRCVRGEMLILRTTEISLSRPIRFLHPRIPIYIVPRADHHFMVGATMIESESTAPISVRSTMELINAAYALHPAFGEASIVETGTGLRPSFPDNFPRIALDGNRLSINGLYRHGFLLSPAMARMAATQVIEQMEKAGS